MVYLIHFENKLSHAQHYIGYCEDGRLDQRFAEHLAGTGANILKVCNERGIKYEVARTWAKWGRKKERFLKNTKSAPKYCPICREEKQQQRLQQRFSLLIDYAPPMPFALRTTRLKRLAVFAKKVAAILVYKLGSLYIWVLLNVKA